MRQKCLEFIIYMFITKWDKENLQTCSCYMSLSEWAKTQRGLKKKKKKMTDEGLRAAHW